MYGNTIKQLWLKFKIALVLAIIGTVIMVIANIVGGTGFDIRNVGDLFKQLALIVFSPVLMTIAVYGLLLNYRNIFKGIVAPIPVVSMIIEYLKGFFMSICAFVYLIKNRKNEDSANE